MYDKFLAPLELYKWKCLCLSFTMSWSCQISWPFKSKSSYQFFSWSAWIFQYITNYNKFIKSSKSSSSKFDFLHKIVKKYDIRYDFWGKSTHCMTFRSKVWRLPKSMTTPVSERVKFGETFWLIFVFGFGNLIYTHFEKTIRTT